MACRIGLDEGTRRPASNRADEIWEKTNAGARKKCHAPDRLLEAVERTVREAEDIAVEDEAAHLCDPDKAEAFCRALPELAVFAPACGTAHGYYHGEPKVAFDLLADISHRTGRPLALHGGTGLPDETVRRCIANGCAKVNLSTNLKRLQLVWWRVR